MSKLVKALFVLVFFSIVLTLFKSRFPVSVTLNHVLDVSQDLLQIRSYVFAEEPNIDIHNFIGTFSRVSAYITVLLNQKPLSGMHPIVLM